MTYPNYSWYNPQYLQNAQQIPQMAQMQQTQQNSIVGVSNENEARTYPVGINTSVTFRDESQPNTFYTKTMGSSPLDSPTFECYKLVKIESVSNAQQATETPPKEKDIDLSVYALKTDVETILGLIEGVQNDITKLKDKYKKRILKEVEDDE